MTSDAPRREFLRRLAKPRATDVAGGLDNQTSAGVEKHPTDDRLSRELSLTAKAMGGEFQVIFNLGQYEQAMDAGLSAIQLLEPLEEMMSYFRPRGELGRINALAAYAPVPVSDELWNLLVFCRELWEATDRAFDITAGALWEVWGFARRQGMLPSKNELDEAMENIGWDFVELDKTNKTVAFKKPGVRLNLGSIGKGYAIDRMAVTIEGFGVHDYLIHGGKSSILTRGSRIELETGKARNMPGWPVGIAHPLHRTERLAELSLHDRSLATSGTTFQFFYHQGKRYGHVLDPRSGRPVDHVLSVTVLADTAATADALSTAFFVTGPTAAEAIRERLGNLGAVFILPGKSGEKPEMVCVGDVPKLDPAGL